MDGSGKVKSIVNVLGSFILTVILIGFPVLTTCAYCFKWNGHIRFYLLVAFVFEFIWVFCKVISLVNED